MAPFYTINHDGADVLNKSYKLYALVKNKVSFNQIAQESIIPQSLLFVLHSCMFFLLFGASRLSALSINFFYFALIQFFGFYVIHRLTNSYKYGFLFLGLVLSLSSPYFWAGGINDFRIDFFASCFYGVFIGSVLNSNVFENRKWTLIASIFAAFLIFMRFIASFYIIGIIGLMYLAYLMDFITHLHINSYKFNFCIETYPDKKRIQNLLIFSCVFSFFLLLLLYFSKDFLINYYFVGHYSGEEKFLRLTQAGVNSLFEYFFYYPMSLLNNHIGFLMLKIIIFIFLSSIFLFFVSIKNMKATYQKNAKINFRVFYFLIYSLAAPFVILTTDFSKSPVVASIMVIPFLYLIVYGLWALNSKIRNKGKIFLEYLFVMMTLACGFFNFINNNNGPLYFINQTPGLYQLYDVLINYARINEKKTLKYGTDGIYDFLAYSAMNNYAYETKRINLSFEQSSELGGSMNAYSKELILTKVKEMDFMILNQTHKNDSDFLFPSEKILEKNMKSIRKEIQKHFRYAGKFQINNSNFDLYLNTRKNSC